MQDERFFHSTRGKIVTALRRRHSATAVELADEFALSTNAVRQQLLALERDGYVAERSVRRGPTKPTLEYSLTEGAESLFPQQYDKMLNAVLREVKEKLGKEALRTVLEGLGKRAADRVRSRVDSDDPKDKVIELAAFLRENGVEADVVETSRGAIELREHNCPYAKTVSEYPEVCTIIHTMLHETVPNQVHQIESIATGGDTCRFELERKAAAAGSNAT